MGGSGGGGGVKTTDGACGDVFWKRPQQRGAVGAGTSGGGPGRAAYCGGCRWGRWEGSRPTMRMREVGVGSVGRRAWSGLSGGLGVWGAGRGQTLVCEPRCCRPIEQYGVVYAGSGRRPLESSRTLSWWSG